MYTRNTILPKRFTVGSNLVIKHFILTLALLTALTIWAPSEAKADGMIDAGEWLFCYDVYSKPTVTPGTGRALGLTYLEITPVLDSNHQFTLTLPEGYAIGSTHLVSAETASCGMGWYDSPGYVDFINDRGLQDNPITIDGKTPDTLIAWDKAPDLLYDGRQDMMEYITNKGSNSVSMSIDTGGMVGHEHFIYYFALTDVFIPGNAEPGPIPMTLSHQSGQFLDMQVVVADLEVPDPTLLLATEKKEAFSHRGNFQFSITETEAGAWEKSGKSVDMTLPDGFSWGEGGAKIKNVSGDLGSFSSRIQGDKQDVLSITAHGQSSETTKILVDADIIVSGSPDPGKITAWVGGGYTTTPSKLPAGEYVITSGPGDDNGKEPGDSGESSGSQRETGGIGGLFPGDSPWWPLALLLLAAAALLLLRKNVVIIDKDTGKIVKKLKVKVASDIKIDISNIKGDSLRIVFAPALARQLTRKNSRIVVMRAGEVLSDHSIDKESVDGQVVSEAEINNADVVWHYGEQKKKECDSNNHASNSNGREDSEGNNNKDQHDKANDGKEENPKGEIEHKVKSIDNEAREVVDDLKNEIEKEVSEKENEDKG